MALEIIRIDSTRDGIRYSLWRDGENLIVADGNGRPPSRARMSNNVALALMGAMQSLTYDQLPTAIRAANKAERAGKSISDAILAAR